MRRRFNARHSARTLFISRLSHLLWKFVLALNLFFCFEIHGTVNAQEVTMHRFDKSVARTWYRKWLLNSGEVLAAEDDDKETSAVVYSADGHEVWRSDFAAADDLLQVVETASAIYLLVFESSADPASRDRYFVGNYMLFRCKLHERCELFKTFKEGVTDVKVTNDELWVVEFKFQDVHLSEAPPFVPWFATLQKYSLDGQPLAEGQTFEGLRAVDLGCGLIKSKPQSDGSKFSEGQIS